ncbi:MAG TPA: LysM peptidoglycan-binding domain-containing protein [Bacillales bacterium]|nr:LysM peptidoglycan-binding domain-containing protein [Bacillales bacterium]
MKKVLSLFVAALFALALSIPSAANAATSTHSYYTVQSGDTMWEISQKFHVNVGTLLRANPQIDNPNVIYVGQHVQIPGKSSGGGSTYVVKSGDSMWGISQKFNVNYSALMNANPQIKNPSVIYAGETVNIPGQGHSTTSNTNSSSSSSSKSGALSQYEQEVVNLVNQQRAKHGLQPLKVTTNLSKMADVKAADMRDHNYFSHTSPTYGSPFDMMKQFGISYSYAGENIAAGQRTPQEVMNAWMNSPGHRANILNSHYTYIGVGYVQGGSYGSYWVQEFISK